jgi:hypothetical protein
MMILLLGHCSQLNLLTGESGAVREETVDVAFKKFSFCRYLVRGLWGFELLKNERVRR